MNILIISQCSKNALTETRRILDQFAERKGSRTWQTAITNQGLLTLRKMLRQTARRNTAVACHWLHQGGYTELLWIIGNKRKFNENGTIPTNTTERDVLRSHSENSWRTLEDIALTAALAGLFHDLGKATLLFQNKLKNAAFGTEPYRHEWVALRLFLAFVNGQTDQKWLQRLESAQINEKAILQHLLCDGLHEVDRPFAGSVSPLAEFIGWLIVSHHKLPKWLEQGLNGREPKIRTIDKWLSRWFDGSWNSPQCGHPDWKDKHFKQLWSFPEGLPIASSKWQKRAQLLAGRTLQRPQLISGNNRLLTDPFLSHLARLCLMLSDHIYSSRLPTPYWQDQKCKLYANTDRPTGELKQKLDEHLIGVSHNSYFFAKSLPKLPQSLPALSRHKGFTRRSKNSKFRWQDKAYELACSIQARSDNQGFFGVNMASTGCGKTFANGRIMYGLANDKAGCRFNVALGLRTLTLQTGEALRSRLGLNEDDLAVMIGSQAVRELHERESAKSPGPDSADELFEENTYVHYEGTLDDCRLTSWLRDNPQLHKLVSAPILVSTIDHLIPATEGDKGGRQIAPMLRLLSSDLILDEPDDFDTSDLPALCRLVNWAGMLGSKVLLSSATLPPALIKALFSAYKAGRKAFQDNCGAPGTPLNIPCAWFDEHAVAQSDHCDSKKFTAAHTAFVTKRIQQLEKALAIRKSAIIPVSAVDNSAESAVAALATTIHKQSHSLHSTHALTSYDNSQKISIGLVRMANINPLVAVARKLLETPPLPDHHLHLCVYHSQQPLIVRSRLEHTIDQVLTRHDPLAVWSNPVVSSALKMSPEPNHVFIVLATSVAEVGRDHDYDWAIAEPSSMRSLIQLAGRIQRHRKITPASENLLILSKNYRALIGQEICFSRPGFECKDIRLLAHDLTDLLDPSQYREISSIPRIIERPDPTPAINLVDLEHHRIAMKLFGAEESREIHADIWWKNFCHWCAEIQQRTPFRKSEPDMEYIFHLEGEAEQGKFHKVDANGEIKLCDLEFERIEIKQHDRVSFWANSNPEEEILNIADAKEMNIHTACRKFGSIRLKERNWQYHPTLGVHQSIHDR